MTQTLPPSSDVAATPDAPARTALAPRLATALLEITATEPTANRRWVLKAVCALFAVLVLWACFARLDIVAVAQGALVPQTAVKIVQPAEGGVVREILVDEGDAVQAGQVLVRLDPTVASADNRSARVQLASKRLELRRVESQLTRAPLVRLSDEDPALFAQIQSDAAARIRAKDDARRQEEATLARMDSELQSARETLDKLQRTLPSYQRSAEAYEKLAQEHLVGALASNEKSREYLEKQQDAKAQQATVSSLESSVRSQRARLAQITSEYERGLQAERGQLITHITELDAETRKQGYREGLLELKASQAGIVKDLLTTTLGAVVQPGTVLLTVVPVGEPLIAEVYIDNQDIGFVRKGQMARVKLTAYPFTKYGLLEGTVTNISADAMQSNPDKASRAGGSVANRDAPTSPFKARVELGTQGLSWQGTRLPVAAGMQVVAEIRQGQRSVLEYLLSPVRRVASEAGGER